MILFYFIQGGLGCCLQERARVKDLGVGTLPLLHGSERLAQTATELGGYHLYQLLI